MNTKIDFRQNRVVRETNNSFDGQRRPRLTGTQDFNSGRNRSGNNNSQRQWGQQKPEFETADRPREYSNSGLSPGIVQDRQVFERDARRNVDVRENDYQYREPSERLRPTQQESLASENERLKRQLLDAKYEQDQKDRELEDAEQYARRLTVKDRRRANELEDLKYRRDFRRDVDYSTARNPSRLVGDNDKVIVGNSRDTQSYTRIPNRNEATPQPTNKLPAFAIEGPEVGARQPVLANSDILYRRMQVLWFVMFASVGLNFYLAWIARGFYVRYEELADEIRDTFTSTM